MKRFALVILFASVVSLSFSGAALAHAKIDHCIPAISSTVASAPSQIVCVMTEEIDTKLSTMAVYAADGSRVDQKDAHVDLDDPDHKTLIVTLDPSRVKDGVYTVKYHTVTPDDSGITDDSFQFTVASTPAAPTATTITVGPAASQTPAPTSTAAAPTTAPATGSSPSTGIALIAAAVCAGVLLVIGMRLARSG